MEFYSYFKCNDRVACMHCVYVNMNACVGLKMWARIIRPAIMLSNIIFRIYGTFFLQNFMYLFTCVYIALLILSLNTQHHIIMCMYMCMCMYKFIL